MLKQKIWFQGTSYELQARAPEVFLDLFTWRGTPWILYKDDLAGTFLAAGAVWFFLRFETRPRPWPLALSVACAAATLTTGNRASALGLVVAQVGGRLLIALSSRQLPRAEEISIDGRVLAFTAVLTLITAVAPYAPSAADTAPRTYRIITNGLVSARRRPDPRCTAPVMTLSP